LMGVGSPEALINGVLRGIDIFDCVLPTRLARHQSAFTHAGRINLMNAGFAHDKGPIEEGCECYACRTFTRAYLRHLIVAKELLAGTLVSIHNIQFLVNLMSESRQAILGGQFTDFASDFLSRYKTTSKKVSA
ncbi:tRNA-guanine transglycosylase, partial [bacterium]|nr:tRNA-guanine transglycosylase [bacterium]